MLLTERDKTREDRKQRIMNALADGKSHYTNEIALKINVTWPSVDRLLQEMVAEKRLSGNKIAGYKLYQEPNIWQKLMKIVGVKK